jgi:hypothetical protein
MKKYTFILVMFSLIFILVVGLKTKNPDYESTNYYLMKDNEYTSGNYAIDINKEEEVIGFSDYVFIAKIVEEKGTIYKDVKRTSSGREISTPYTHYSVIVVENLKGELLKSEEIEINKYGGCVMNKDELLLLEGDCFFKPGKYYLIMASAQSDGSLLQTAPTAHFEFNELEFSKIKDSNKYEYFIEKVKNQVKYERKRFKANKDNSTD